MICIDLPHATTICYVYRNILQFIAYIYSMFPQHLALEIKNLSQEKSVQNILQNISQTWKNTKEKRHSRLQDLTNPQGGCWKSSLKQLVKLLIIKPAIFVWANHGEWVGTPCLNPWTYFILSKLVTHRRFFKMKLLGWIKAIQKKTPRIGSLELDTLMFGSEIPYARPTRVCHHMMLHCLELEYGIFS